MPPASAALRRVAAITALVAGCERAGADPAFVPPGTLIAVQVQATDRATALSATTVTVRVRHDGDPTPYLTLTRALGAERLREPGVLPHLFPGVRGVQTPITVEATLTRDEGPPVVQLARVRFTPGFATKLVMDLNAACVAAPPCPGDQTCGGEGRCVPVLRDPLPLLEGGAPPGFDASLAPADASRDDLATPAGDGPSPCEGGPCAPLRLAGIAAGDATTCAWSEGGDVWCWGARVWGDGAPASRPTPVGLVAGAAEVSLAGALCAAMRDGTVRCAPTSAIPLGLQRLRGVREVRLGRAHACARLDDGAVRCAGDNRYGQCGESFTESPQPLTPVEGLATANALALGGDLSCALRDGRVFCWGSDRGSLLQAMAGDTSIRKCASWSCRGAAAAVGDLATVRRVSVRGTGEGDAPHLACAVHAAGAVTCWGRRGLLGRGEPLDPNGLSDAPGPVIEGLAAQEVQVGEGFACALTTAGGVACWGAVQGCRAGRPGAEGEVAPRPVPLALSGVRALAVGARHACALVGDAEVWCWGDGAQGQLGHGALAAPAGCAPVRAELAP